MNKKQKNTIKKIEKILNELFNDPIETLKSLQSKIE
jgi:Txe/YoeB family toxin of Txe-Axe toxin-antitoxin module